MIKFNIRELLCNLTDNFIPHNHSVSLSIRLGDISEFPARSRLSELESKSCDSLDTDTSKDGNFCSGQNVRTRKAMRFVEVHTGGNFMVVTSVRSSTMTSVLALGVLSDNHPVKLASLAVSKR